jgi:hypothetical protein
MPRRKTLASLPVAVVLALSALITVGQQSVKPIHEQPRYRKWPIKDLSKPEPAASEAQEVRKIRGDRFNLRDKSVNPRRFAITEDRESGFGSPEIHAPVEPALPVADSNLIVIAAVKSGDCFLSNDKTAIYSEFELSVAEVIHDGSSSGIVAGTTITAVRAGGMLRFPSGKVIVRGNNAKPLPDVGSRYLFFLSEESEKYFDIVTAYEFRGGSVFPLDGRAPNGWVFPQFGEHQKFAGTDETAFLFFVRQAIGPTSNPNGGE